MYMASMNVIIAPRPMSLAARERGLMFFGEQPIAEPCTNDFCRPNYLMADNRITIKVLVVVVVNSPGNARGIHKGKRFAAAMPQHSLSGNTVVNLVSNGGVNNFMLQAQGWLFINTAMYLSETLTSNPPKSRSRNVYQDARVRPYITRTSY